MRYVQKRYVVWGIISLFVFISLGIIHPQQIFSKPNFLDISLFTTPTVTVTPTPTASPTPTPTATPTVTPTPTPFPTATPTPTLPPIPTPVVVSSADLDTLFSQYSNQYKVDKSTLVSIAQCESNLHPGSRGGDYGGLFQFSTNTWTSTRTQMNLDPNPDLRFNPEEAIKTAAFKISAGGIGSWQNCIK